MAQNITPESLISILAAALAQKPTKPLVLALDGRCGSGKTTLAAQLAERFPQSITVHTDDFYLPPSRRVTGWEKIPCANMDIQRLRDEVIAPARAGQAFSYQAYSCREGAYLPPAQRVRGWEKTPCANMDLIRLRDEALRPAYEGQPVLYRAYSCRAGAYQPVQEFAAQPLVILEGSYSHHPLLAGYETLQVFVTCSREEQTRRLQAREGERYANFAARWIPLEEGYCANYSIEENAEMMVVTD